MRVPCVQHDGNLALEWCQQRGGSLPANSFIASDVRSIMGIAQQGCHQMAPDALLD